MSAYKPSADVKNLNAWIGKDEHKFLKDTAHEEQMTVTMFLRMLIREERARRQANKRKKS